MASLLLQSYRHWAATVRVAPVIALAVTTAVRQPFRPESSSPLLNV